ncbi:MAG TPA: AraC family transcriptional regulator [Sphingobacteriaceae bacterium]|nr:AraC family transcriptional regulator [Sphingobacteriaceae bacterium]
MRVSFTYSHPSLRPYIKGYYCIELDCHAAEPLDIHPIGYNTIAFTLNPKAAFKPDQGRQYDFNLSYHGFISKHISLIPLQASIKVVIVSFTNTGISQLFGICQSEVINQIIPLEHINAASRSLKQKLEDTIFCEQKALILIDNWLLEQLKCRSHSPYFSHIDQVCQLIQTRCGDFRIRELCREVNMSQSSLERHFKEMIGITPKHYCRIIRFIAVYQFILNNTNLHWGELVYRYNFFDQAHFIKDFKNFFGFSPSKVHLANAKLTRELTLKI